MMVSDALTHPDAFSNRDPNRNPALNCKVRQVRQVRQTFTVTLRAYRPSEADVRLITHSIESQRAVDCAPPHWPAMATSAQRQDARPGLSMWNLSTSEERVDPTPSATFEVFARCLIAKLKDTAAASVKTMAKQIRSADL
jgi:hypothetical protein